MKKKIEVFVKPEPRRKDSFWFPSGKELASCGDFWMMATGLIRVTFDYTDTSDGVTLRNEEAVKYAKKKGFTDRKLHGCNTDWNNNNWFEIRSNTNDEWCHNDMPINYDEAIKLLKKVANEEKTPKEKEIDKAVGACPNCGATKHWYNDVPLKAFCWGTEENPHKEWSKVVPAPFQPYK